MSGPEMLLRAIGKIDPALIQAAEMMGRSKHRVSRRLTSVLIAAAILLALSITAYAIANYTDFFEKVFGGPDAGAQSYDLLVDHWNEDGSRDTMEIITEGEPVDQDTAQKVLDGSVSAPHTSITVGDYTCTVENVTMAENGMGVLTYSVENPNGLPEVHVFDETVKNFNFADDRSETDVAGGGLRGIPMFSASENWDDPMVDNISFLVTATDTRLEAKAYIALFGDIGCPESLNVYFFQDEGEQYRLTVPLPEPAEEIELTGPDGWAASISPMGLAIMSPEEIGGDYESGNITVHYTNSDEYVVTSSEPYVKNSPISCMNESGTTRYVFNRLIDPAEVSSVTVQVQSYITDELKDLTFTK